MNRFSRFYASLASILAIAVAVSCTPKAALSDIVDPAIGTAYTGHTYPGAVLPFGMVSPSPDTGLNDWPHCPGYHYDDSSILGFSQTHMSGTGAPDMCDLMLIPVTGEPKFEPGTPGNPDEGYRSRFSHESESSRPGYYAVTLDDYGVRCEMTASERCSFYRFSYPDAAERKGLIFDMLHGNDGGIRDSDVSCEGDRVVKGWRRSRGFIRDHVYYFWAEFSEPVKSSAAYAGAPGTDADPQVKHNSKLYVEIAGGKPLLVRMGVSTVSEAAAKANLEAEISGRSFESVSKEAAGKWDEALSAINATFATPDEEKIFYTALYHSMIVPNLITDADGSYRGWDGKIHRNESGDFYTNYSLWDTYRAVHPLFNLICPDRNVAFVNSMLERFDQIGMLPINEYGTCETYCMIGYHSVPVIADAILQDLPGFDYERAWKAMKAIAEGVREKKVPGYVPSDPEPNIEAYTKYGYVPGDIEPNSVSETLEYAYDDWCMSLVAKKLGKDEEAAVYARRALSYENVYDPETGFTRGRLSDGSWRTPFDPDKTSAHDHDFIEGNAWQYTFYVPHDMDKYVEMNGGKEAFAAKLDEMFTKTLEVDNIEVPDVTGLIGQYAHGNEPSHHVAYLYNYAGQPWKTQEMVARIKKEMYGSGPDGLCGNDDCGQMSAWYVFGVLGFYPVAPGSGLYDIGSPSVCKAEISLPGGKKFTVSTKNTDGGTISSSDVYIQSATLNGKPFEKNVISLEEILAGGGIEFTMGPEPKIAKN